MARKRRGQLQRKTPTIDLGVEGLRVPAADADRIVLAVIDDGRGIPEEKITLALLGMRERARALDGNVVVRRNPGGGTTVEASLPP